LKRDVLEFEIKVNGRHEGTLTVVADGGQVFRITRDGRAIYSITPSKGELGPGTLA
jgi:hypothetical protein